MPIEHTARRKSIGAIGTFPALLDSDALTQVRHACSSDGICWQQLNRSPLDRTGKYRGGERCLYQSFQFPGS